MCIIINKSLKITATATATATTWSEREAVGTGIPRNRLKST